MKYCPNCGGQVSEGMNNCPNCGGVLEGNTNTTYTSENPASSVTYTTQNIGTKPLERNIVLAIVYTFITCGIYGLYWFYCLTEDANNVCNDNKTASGGLAILFTFLTCGIYTFYWMYKQGKKLNEAGTLRGETIEDNSVLYLILNILGLGIVSYCLMQDSLNRLSK